jgi:hypothetical protein
MADARVNQVIGAEAPALPANWPGMPPLVAKAVTQIMTEVGGIGKTGRNEFHKYKFMEAAELDAALQPLMAEAGLVVVQSELALREFNGAMLVTYGFGLSANGETWDFQVRRTGMATLYNNKGGIDDKAINKCDTAARKYFLKDLFAIPTLDANDKRLQLSDGDADADPPRQQTPIVRYAFNEAIGGGQLRARELVLPSEKAWKENWYGRLDDAKNNRARDHISALWMANEAVFQEIAKANPEAVNQVLSGILDVVGMRDDVNPKDWEFPLLNYDTKVVGIRGVKAWLDGWRRTVDSLASDADAVNAIGLWRSEMARFLPAVEKVSPVAVKNAHQYVDATLDGLQKAAGGKPEANDAQQQEGNAAA